jgi:hypothetical protein
MTSLLVEAKATTGTRNSDYGEIANEAETKFSIFDLTRHVCRASCSAIAGSSDAGKSRPFARRKNRERASTRAVLIEDNKIKEVGPAFESASAIVSQDH